MQTLLFVCVLLLTTPAAAVELMLPTLEVTPTRGADDKGYAMHVGFVLRGPVAAGSEVVATFTRADRAWSTARAPLSPFEGARWIDLDGEATSVEVGVTAFTITLEQAGASTTLFSGEVNVIGGGGDYVVQADWLLGLGRVALDSDYSQRSPPLRAVFWMPGGEARYAATLLFEGKPIAEASIDASRALTTRSGRPAYSAVEVTFGAVIGWLAGADESQSRHRLDRHPGRYEVQLTQRGTLVRSLVFEVKTGRLVPGGAIVSDGRRYWLHAPVTPHDGAKFGAGSFYGGGFDFTQAPASAEVIYRAID